MKCTLRTTRRLLPLIPLLFFCLLLCAQSKPVLSLSQHTIDPAAAVRVNLTVRNFNKIAGGQFSIRWDSTVLRLEGVEDPALDLTAEDNFNLLMASGGVINFLFEDKTMQGASLADNSVLFGLRFTAIGGDGDSSRVFFSNDPLPIELYDMDLNTMDLDLEDGVVNIALASSAAEPEPGAAYLKAFPNPFAIETILSWEQEHAAPVEWIVRDARGRTVFSGQRNYTPGRQQLRLRGSDLPAAGTYFIQMQTDNQTITRKIIFIEP